MVWFNAISRWYVSGKWSAEQVQRAVPRGWLTQAQADEIIALEVTN